MKRIVVLSLFLSILSGLSAQEKPDYYAEHRQKWLDLAEKNKPELVWSVWKPQAIVSISKDTTSFQDLPFSITRALKSFGMTGRSNLCPMCL